MLALGRGPGTHPSRAWIPAPASWAQFQNLQTSGGLGPREDTGLAACVGRTLGGSLPRWPCCPIGLTVTSSWSWGCCCFQSC